VAIPDQRGHRGPQLGDRRGVHPGQGDLVVDDLGVDPGSENQKAANGSRRVGRLAGLDEKSRGGSRLQVRARRVVCSDVEVVVVAP
jgi:hypothetical protein